MRIKYSPLIDVTAKIDSIDSALEGGVIMRGTIKGRDAQLFFTTAEALHLYRELKAMDIEALARVHS